MTVPDPDNESESSDSEVDPFEELGVQANPSNASVSDGLAAFMEDEEDDDTESTTEPIIESEQEDDDDDLFATLGVAGPAVALTSSGEDDILAAFMEDEEGEQEERESPQAEEPPSETPVQPEAKEAYRMVLETVWVDGVLDPGEVNLLARKREDLGISFEEHLTIVRDMLG